MKTLQKYINDNIYQFYPINSHCREFGELMLGYLSDRMKEMASNDCWFDPIHEALTSHDSTELADRIWRLKDKYGILDVYCIGGDDIQKCSMNVVLPKGTEIGTDFKNLVNLFGYTIRQCSNNDKYDFVVLEPTYPHDDGEFIMDDCDGWCYHFTTANNAERIFKSGIRPKGSFHATKSYAERTYVYANKQMYLDRLPKSVQQELAKAIIQIIGKQNVKNLAILRINLNKPTRFAGKFYEDTLMPGCYFTYYPIEKERIKQVHCPKLEDMIMQQA